jgi:hypothetical protein
MIITFWVILNIERNLLFYHGFDIFDLDENMQNNTMSTFFSWYK